MHTRVGNTVRISVVVFGMATAAVYATPLTWITVAGGSAGTSTNWSPAQVPGGADDLAFALNNIYTVTYNATTTASQSHTYRFGTVTATFSSPHTASGGLTVGSVSPDNATLNLTSGNFTANGNGLIANATGTLGRINVQNSNADLNIGGDLTVGASGSGTLSITGVGRVQVADQFIAGANNGGAANVTVSGFSIAPIGVSILDVLGSNESRIGAGGDVTMTVSSGGVASFASDVVIANGSASTSTVTVETAGLLNARFNVGGDLRIARNTGSPAAGVGTLNINTGGTVTVDGTSFLGDPDGGTGFMHLNGGTFNGTGAVTILAGSTIDGTGTINAPITNSGNINPTGAAGLTFGGILSNTTNLVTGTKVHFAGTGGYSGSGLCNADITGDATSTITATGTLSIGRNLSSGFSYNGTLDVGGNIVTLIDSNGAVLGGLTKINNGRIECAAGIGNQNGARIQGVGLLVGDVVNSGVLDPLTPNPSFGALITIQGDLLCNPTSVVDMAITGSPASGDYDRINVSGTATFGGTLKVSLPTGYVPHVGEQFIAVNATLGRIGTFDAITPPSPSPCNNVTFVLVYSSTAAIVLVRPPLGCTALGDLNSDGSINGKDIQLFVRDVVDGNYDACADMNGDCLDNAGDITVFMNALL